MSKGGRPFKTKERAEIVRLYFIEKQRKIDISRLLDVSISLVNNTVKERIQKMENQQGRLYK